MPPRDDATLTHFILLGREPGYKQARSRCKYCSRSITSGSGTNRLREHLKTCVAFTTTQNTSSPPQSAPDVVSGSTTTQQVNLFLRQAAKAAFCGGRPFSLFEEPSMKLLLQQLHPSFEPPTRSQIAGELLDDVYLEYKTEVRNMIRKSEYINVIFDGSEDYGRRSVINLSIHLPFGFAFYWKTIYLQDIQDIAINLLDILLPLLEDLTEDNIEKVHAISTDTSSMMRLFHDLASNHPRLQHVICVFCDSHGLQLLIKDIVKHEPWATILQKATIVINSFRASPLQYSRLRKSMIECEGKTVALLQAVITRWGSQQRCLESCSYNRKAFLHFLHRQDVQQDADPDRRARLIEVANIVGDHEFWANLDILLELLKPVTEAQEQSETNGANIGQTFDRWNKIKEHWESLRSNGDRRFQRVNWEALFTVINSRILKQLNPANWSTTALNPSTVGMPLTFSAQKDALELIQRYGGTRAVNLIEEFYAFRNQSGFFDPTSGMLSVDQNPQVYWGIAEASGSKLAPLAKRLFNTIVNSVPSERAFISQNYLQNALRNRLSVDQTDKLAFIYMNSHTLRRIENKEAAKTFSNLTKDEVIELEQDLYSQMLEDLEV